jgi:hypothetical protein
MLSRLTAHTERPKGWQAARRNDSTAANCIARGADTGERQNALEEPQHSRNYDGFASSVLQAILRGA